MATMLLQYGEFFLESLISKSIYEPEYNFYICGYMCMMFVTEENNTLKVGLKPFPSIVFAPTYVTWHTQF